MTRTEQNQKDSESEENFWQEFEREKKAIDTSWDEWLP